MEEGRGTTGDTEVGRGKKGLKKPKSKSPTLGAVVRKLNVVSAVVKKKPV